MPRLFIALDLPEALRHELASWRESWSGARWVAAEKMHLTLRFLGETPDEQLPALQAALATVRAPAFSLQLQGAGSFGPRRKPLVLWIGIGPESKLGGLYEQVESSLQAIDIAPEMRPFNPHITLARLKGTSGSLVDEFCTRHRDFHSASFAVNEFRLYASTLGREGGHYEALAAFPLS